MSAYDNLFTATKKRCPRCDLHTVNRLNKMLICEVCGWYESEVKKPIKPEKRKAKRIRKPMSEFMLNASSDNN